ncbi:protein prenylyltransferase [Dendrothele bispora CBS 962.96]|uniref:Protein prenylyltransferase n=1 Tax=Dendrothele bispora (strain CBS 962.96) TaxID=1314807 RepID=A0A4S8KSW9_DENBC|nr:protein prenylyltransferase [Dendrothele bispora CBS 962.96]
MSLPATAQDRDVALVQRLGDLIHEIPSSVEIIPGGMDDWSLTPEFPVLYTEGNIGMPHKVLLRLYLCALSPFNLLRPNLRTNLWSDEQSKMLLNSSAILLHANPAHQTALNARKCFIQSGKLSAQQELGFTRNLLCSSHECAKQSIIWAHRQWLLRRHYACDGTTGNVTEDGCNIPAEVLQNELDLVKRCSKSYPRNYHAWTHWQFCVEMAYHQELYSFLTDVYLQLEKWIEQNVSDYSAIHHFGKMTKKLQVISFRKPGTLQVDVTPYACLNRATAFLSRYPEHESLWMYLRVVCDSPYGLDPDWRDSVEETIRSLPDNMHRRRCVSWLSRTFQ